MELGRIGKYIAAKRQEKGFTQESLAEELGVSDRSISKWERGVCLPDANNMARLCKLFGISYNELLSGEDLKKVDYEKKAEENLREFAKVETALNKKFLMYEYVIGYMASLPFIILVMTASFAEMPTAARVVLLALGLTNFVVGMYFCVKIETEAGKYKCGHCGHLYVPKYASVLMSMHIGRTRYMTCPKCHKKSWQRKVA